MLDEHLPDIEPIQHGHKGSAVTQTINSPLASSHQLVINIYHRMLVCVNPNCLQAIRADRLRKHLRQRHGLRISASRVQELAGAAGIEEKTPFPSRRSPAVASIAVLKGYACSHCDFACVSVQHANRHVCQQPDSVIQQTCVQRPYRDLNKFFECVPVAAAERGPDALSKAYEAEIARLLASFSNDQQPVIRNVSYESSEAWMKRIGISEFACDKSQRELIRLSTLVDLPPVGELNILSVMRGAVGIYIKRAKDRLLSMDTRQIRQALRSDIPCVSPGEGFYQPLITTPQRRVSTVRAGHHQMLGQIQGHHNEDCSSGPSPSAHRKPCIPRTI